MVRGMMLSVGVYDAKTTLPRLLSRVARGERITITKHGVPIVRLVPASRARAVPRGCGPGAAGVPQGPEPRRALAT